MAYTPPPGYHVVESDQLPDQWRLLESNKGRRVYETPPPRTLIQTRKQLIDLQKSGKFKDLDPTKAIFVSKQKVQRKKTFQILNKIQCDSIKSKEDKVSTVRTYRTFSSEGTMGQFTWDKGRDQLKPHSMVKVASF